MKRGAERQLTKDDADENDDIEEVEGAQGFRKADDAELARRPMRGLPKRSLASAAANAPVPPPVERPVQPAPSPETPGVPKFSGFSGFGAPSSSATPFAFTAPSVPKSTAAPTTSASNGFSLFNPSSSSGSGLFSSPSSTTSNGVSVAPTASAATKTFASFLGPSSSGSSTNLSTQVMPSPTANTEANTTDEATQAEVTYLVALRGLNESLLSAISKAIEADPFVDVAGILEKYKTLRVGAKTTYDEKLKELRPSGGASTALGAIGPSTSSNAVTLSSTSSSSSQAAVPSSSFAMPTAPSGFAGFKPLATSSAPSSSATDNAKSKVSTTSGGFIFSASNTGATAGASAAPKSAFASSPSFGSSSTSSSFSFSSSSSSESKPSESPFEFGKTDTTKPSDPSKFIFPSSSSSPSPSSFFGKPADTEKDQEKAGGSAFAFSSTPSSGTSLFGSTPSFGTPEKPSSSGLSFGTASPGKSNPFGGFGSGSKSGSIGNPVGFGFATSKASDSEEGTSSKSAGFSFAAPPKAETSLVPVKGSESSESMSDQAPEDEAQPPLIATSVHDQAGEGEENEETMHEIRSKAFKMVRNEGKSEWKDLGVGMLRLKKHKETDSRRMLLRNSSTGKITVNFLLYHGMNVTVAKNVVSFIGHTEGTSTPYRIKTKTEEQAKDLKSALDHEIEFVHSKSEP